jgi:hypothetical protein
MNIFWVAAIYYSVKHFCIIREITQMLYAAHYVCGDPSLLPEGAYKLTHENHPVTKWVRGSGANYLAALEKAEEVANEYYLRYGRHYACEPHLRWLAAHVPSGLEATRGMEHLTVAPCLAGDGSPAWTPDSWAALKRAHVKIYCTIKRHIAIQMGNPSTGVRRISLPSKLEQDAKLVQYQIASSVQRESESVDSCASEST